MSREIKFRAWNNANNEWLNKEDAECLTIYLDGRYEIDMGWVKVFPDLIIEQYTGLKDKNGKEIYEGDIVKRLKPHEFLKNVEETEIFRIRWGVRKAGFFAYSKERKKHNIPAKRLNADDIYEVIGNIHENPGLLEDK